MRIRSSVTRQEPVQAERVPHIEGVSETDRRLGAILQREGILTTADVEQVMHEQVSRNELFGRTAIALGKLTEEQLDAALLLQSDQGYVSQGSQNLDPLLVAAFDLNDNYVNRVRAIRTQILRSQVNDEMVDMHSCALVGLNCEEEVAVIASNLAIVMARLGSPTLLVDASLHNPRLHELFRATNREGLTNLRHDRSLDDVVQQTSINNLWLMPSGPRMPDKGTAFEREPMLTKMLDWRIPSTKLLVSLALRSTDYIATIGGSLAGFDCVIPVVRKHATPISDLRALLDRLDEQGISVLGTVMV